MTTTLTPHSGPGTAEAPKSGWKKLNIIGSPKTPNPITNADRKLIEAYLSTRDERVFRKLYQLHTPVLYLFALRMLGGVEQDAQDVVQETWVRALQSIAGFRWQSSLRTWLIGIAMNSCREVSRNRLPSVDLADSERAEDSYSLPPNNSDLESLISSLPKGCRRVFVLHDIEGYTHEEIGALLGIAVGTSKHQLFRARGKLRESLSSLKN